MTKKELTLGMIKPDATERNLTGDIIATILREGLNVRDMKEKTLTKEEAAFLYDEHANKPHFNDLVTYTVSGPVILLLIEGDNAVSRLRNIMGPSDPNKAPQGTLRALFAIDYRRNSIHGSDSKESAQREISYFFKK